MEKVIAKVPIYEGMETNVKVVNGELVVTTYEKVKEKPFPKLMKAINGEIIFAVGERVSLHAFVLKHPQFTLGRFKDDFFPNSFKDYNGTVEIDSETLKKIYEYGRN